VQTANKYSIRHSVLDSFDTTKKLGSDKSFDKFFSLLPFETNNTKNDLNSSAIIASD